MKIKLLITRVVRSSELSFLSSFLIGTLFTINLMGQETKKKPFKLSIDLEQAESENLFKYSDQNAWRIIDTELGRSLELFGESQYTPPFRSPFNIAIIDGYQFGSFEMTASLKQTGREYGHRDMVIVFGMKDASDFYYVHIASKKDELAHNIFIVNDEPRKAITLSSNDGINWGDEWHTVKIIRDIESGLIEVYFDDMSEPIMHTVDHHFKYGSIGFGSFDDTGIVTDIEIASQNIISKKIKIFD